MSFVLVMSTLFLKIPHRPESNPETIKPFVVGSVLVAANLFAGPLTGASMNPARSLSAAILSNKWEYQWIYWIGTPNCFHYLC